MFLQVSAPGKAMLIGEYAVLESYPAVVAAINCYATATFSQDFSSASSEFVQKAYEQTLLFFKSKGISTPSIALPQVDTRAFYHQGQKLGLGASSAVTVATIGLLFESVRLPIHQHLFDIYSLAKTAHSQAQKAAGSGADILASTWGSIQFLHTPSPIKSIPGHLCLVGTSTSSSTRRLLDRYFFYRQKIRTAITTMGDAASLFIKGIQEGQFSILCEAVEQASESYEELGTLFGYPLLTGDHLLIQKAARQVGGAAKPSGAGGGDLAVVFLPNQEAETEFVNHIPPSTFLLPFSVSSQGVHIQKDS